MIKGLLLTAGLGTRLRPITNVYAKPAVPFLNVPLIYFPFFFLRKMGVGQFVFNSHHLPEQIATLAKKISAESRLSIDVSNEPGAPLGAGGGIKKAEALLRGSDGADFFVCNGDEVILPRHESVFSRFLREHRDSKSLATILVMRHPLVGSQFGGVWCDEKNNVLGFGKTTWPKSANGFHFIGPMILNERVFEYLPEGESNILYDGLTQAIARGEKVRVVVDDFTWFETGNPHDFLHATHEALQLLQKSTGPDGKFLAEVLRQVSPDSQLTRTPSGAVVLHSKNKPLDFAGVTCSGFVVANENARVSPGAQLENVVLVDNVEVKSTDVLKNEIIFRTP